jgi:hypothetical protein
MTIIKSLESSPVVISFTILEYRQFSSGYFINARALIKDGSCLYIREYVDDLERNYSFHWQTSEGLLIIRWDNAPHYRHIQSFPHHKHAGDSVEASDQISLEKVLDYIKTMLGV